MRNKTLILCLLIAVFLTACTAPQTSCPNPEVQTTEISTSTPTPPVDVLLAAALKLFDEGKYEEAILQYTAIINIEPKNFDAQLGLGQSYRKNKQSDKAVEPLKTALNLHAESRSAAIELGYAYLDTGAYAETEKLARELLGERIPDLNMLPTPLSERVEESPAPVTHLSFEDGEALTLLLMSLGGLEKIEEVQALLWDKPFQEYLNEIFTTDDEVLYVGAYNSEGLREGKGVGIYPEGHVYVGNYREGVRSGQGKWYCDYQYFTGEWANDAPNGYGESRWADNTIIHSGNYVNGLEHGEMSQTILGNPSCKQPHTYRAVNGKRVMEERAFYGGGYYVVCHHGIGWTYWLSEDQFNFQWGVSGWGGVG